MNDRELADLALDYVERHGLGRHLIMVESPDLTRQQTERLCEREFHPLRDPHHDFLLEYLLS